MSTKDQILQAIDECTEELKRTTVMYQRTPVTDQQLVSRINLHIRRLKLMNMPWVEDQPVRPFTDSGLKKGRSKKREEVEP